MIINKVRVPKGMALAKHVLDVVAAGLLRVRVFCRRESASVWLGLALKSWQSHGEESEKRREE